MARIDSLLTLIDRQGANELRLGSDREPQMFAGGVQKRLSMPKTPTETLRELLGELLPPDREKMLAQTGQVQFLHEAAGVGAFRVTLTRRGPAGRVDELDVTFMRGNKPAPAPAAAPTPAHAPAPVPAPVPVPVPVPERTPEPATSAGALDPSRELTLLLGRAAGMRASDVHLMDGEAAVVRVDGKLFSIDEGSPADVARLLGPALANEARKRLAQGSSADLGIGVEGVGRFRANVYQASRGLCAAIRLLNTTPPSLADLKLPVPLNDLAFLPHGLVIVCGPTGSGKSSTLAALAQEALRLRGALLITLEDPIEYVLSSRGGPGLVRQRQVGRDVKDFATGLRDALREDPDVLVIGEMRDPETISLALTAAETGHLVLASLHSRSAASAVERIVDAYPSERQTQIRVQLADALRAVVAQRLLPRHCAEGRVAAVEVLRGTHAVANAIRESKTSGLQSAIQAGKKDGMIPLERCLAELVQQQKVSLDAARAFANEPDALRQYLGG